MSNDLINNNTPYYYLEAIYLSSPNFSNDFIQTFEYKLSKILAVWISIDEAIAKDYAKYNNDKELPDYLDRLLFLSSTIDEMIKLIIEDFYTFCNTYLNIDSSRFVPYTTLKNIFLQHYCYYFYEKDSKRENEDTLFENYIKALEKFENINNNKLVINIKTPIRDLLNENPSFLFQSSFTIPLISEHIFTLKDDKINTTQLKEIINFLSSKKMCNLSYNEIRSLVNNKFNINTNKLLWTGKKADAFRFKDYLNLSVSEFNNSFQFEDGKKLQNNHKSTSGWSELSSFLLKISSNTEQ